MCLWTSYHFLHETEYLWTSYNFVHETECIYDFVSFFCMKHNVFMNFVSFFAWNRMCLWTSYHFLHETMYLWTSYHFLHETECIYELRIIVCMKQNVFMSFISFLHLTYISPCNINWLLFVMEIGVFSETPTAFLNIIKPISAFQKIRPICILHCISLNDIPRAARIIKLIMLFCLVALLFYS